MPIKLNVDPEGLPIAEFAIQVLDRALTDVLDISELVDHHRFIYVKTRGELVRALADCFANDDTPVFQQATQTKPYTRNEQQQRDAAKNKQQQEEQARRSGAHVHYYPQQEAPHETISIKLERKTHVSVEHIEYAEAETTQLEVPHEISSAKLQKEMHTFREHLEWVEAEMNEQLRQLKRRQQLHDEALAQSSLERARFWPGYRFDHPLQPRIDADTAMNVPSLPPSFPLYPTTLLQHQDLWKQRRQELQGFQHSVCEVCGSHSICLHGTCPGFTQESCKHPEPSFREEYQYPTSSSIASTPTHLEPFECTQEPYKRESLSQSSQPHNHSWGNGPATYPVHLIPYEHTQESFKHSDTIPRTNFDYSYQPYQDPFLATNPPPFQPNEYTQGPFKLPNPAQDQFNSTYTLEELPSRPFPPNCQQPCSCIQEPFKQPKPLHAQGSPLPGILEPFDARSFEESCAPTHPAVWPPPRPYSPTKQLADLMRSTSTCQSDSTAASGDLIQDGSDDSGVPSLMADYGDESEDEKTKEKEEKEGKYREKEDFTSDKKRAALPTLTSTTAGPTPAPAPVVAVAAATKRKGTPRPPRSYSFPKIHPLLGPEYLMTNSFEDLDSVLKSKLAALNPPDAATQEALGEGRTLRTLKPWNGKEIRFKSDSISLPSSSRVLDRKDGNGEGITKQGKGEEMEKRKVKERKGEDKVKVKDRKGGDKVQVKERKTKDKIKEGKGKREEKEDRNDDETKEEKILEEKDNERRGQEHSNSEELQRPYPTFAAATEQTLPHTHRDGVTSPPSPPPPFLNPHPSSPNNHWIPLSALLDPSESSDPSRVSSWDLDEGKETALSNKVNSAREDAELSGSGAEEGEGWREDLEFVNLNSSQGDSDSDAVISLADGESVKSGLDGWSLDEAMDGAFSC